MYYLDYILLAVSILLILIIVIQNPKSEGMSAFSGEKSDKAKVKQRGFEKTVSNVTTVLSVLFFVASLLLLIIKRG